MTDAPLINYLRRRVHVAAGPAAQSNVTRVRTVERQDNGEGRVVKQHVGFTACLLISVFCVLLILFSLICLSPRLHITSNNSDAGFGSGSKCVLHCISRFKLLGNTNFSCIR